MSDAGVTYTAACPACGVDATWTSWVYRQPTTLGSLGAEASQVSVDCPCTPELDVLPEVAEVVPTMDYGPSRTLASLPMCAHGRLYAGCAMCGTAAHGQAADEVA